MTNNLTPSALRLVFFGFADDVTSGAIARILDGFNVEYVEYYHDAPRDFNRHVPGKSHYYIDVQRGDYKVDWNSLAPLDEPLLDGMAHCEATLMRMFDRNDLWASLPYAERKALYLKHVRYWSDCFDRNRINLVLFSGIPHSTFDYIAYALCKLKGIETLGFSSQSLLIDTSFLTHDIDDPAPALGARFKELCASVPPQERSNVVLADWLEVQFQKMIDTQSDQTPFYMKAAVWQKPFDRKEKSLSLAEKLNRIARSPAPLIRKAMSTEYWAAKRRFRRQWHEQETLSRSLAAFYNDHAHAVDLGRRFIYVPLHLQPEATTSPMGGAFVEQPLMIQLLAASAPADALIYVKEHPMQAKYGVVSRSEAFYQELLDIPSVRLVPHTTSTYDLMKHCAAVATVTGTAGWEGLFRRKPYLMFGHHVYQYAPGVIMVRDRAGCCEAMDAVFGRNFAPEIADLRLFFKAIEETTIRGYAQGNRHDISDVSDDQNVANLAEALIRQIAELGFSPRERVSA